MKFDIFNIFRKAVANVQVWLKSDKNNVYFTWRPTYIYDNTWHTQKNGAVLIVLTIKTAPFFCVCPVSRWILLRLRNVSDKTCRENQNTFYFQWLFPKYCAVCEINVKKYCRAGQATEDDIIRRMRFVYGITKATNTHSEYVILLAFPWQQWLHERASILLYTFIFVTLHVKLETFWKWSCCVLHASKLLCPT